MEIQRSKTSSHTLKQALIAGFLCVFILWGGACRRLTTEDARRMPDYVLFEKIFQHQRTEYARGLSTRQHKNLEIMLKIAHERYPKWDPESAMPPYLGDYKIETTSPDTPSDSKAAPEKKPSRPSPRTETSPPPKPSFDKRRY